MRPNLVAAPGQEFYLKKSHAVAVSQRAVFRSNRQAVLFGAGTDKNPVGSLVLYQESLNFLTFFHSSLHNALIIFLHRPVFKGLAKNLKSRKGTSRRHQAAGISIQTVADGRAEGPKLLGGQLA